MPLQHLELLTVLETDDIVRRNRLFCGYGRYGTIRSLLLFGAYAGKALVNTLNQIGQITDRHGIVRYVSRDNFRR